MCTLMAFEFESLKAVNEYTVKPEVLITHKHGVNRT